MQDRGIDLVGARQLAAIDAGECFAIVEECAADPRPRGSVYIVEAVVRAMVAQRGRGDRRTIGNVVEVTGSKP